MRWRYLWWLLVVAALGAGAWAISNWKNQPPEVQFVRVTREAVHNIVSTNGKVEPIEWAIAHAERPGAVEKILIQRGQPVALDAPLVELDASEARAELAVAQSRITQFRAELDVLNRGGRATDLAEISISLNRAQRELQTAETEYEGAKRREARQVATPYEVTQAKERVDKAKQEIQSIEMRRGALAPPSDKTAAQARLDEAQVQAGLAERRIRTSIIKSPLEGTVYQFDLKPGAYLNAGDAVASIGRLDRVRANIYVDEPDLGRVSKGLAVSITWDALPGRHWEGEVDKTPTQIVANGSRQVGEVVCLIRNPNRDLLPGTNVTAEIKVQSVGNALTIPKEALRTRGSESGVFVLVDDKLAWKKVTQGVANTTRTQVEGLNEGEPVALSSEKPLKDGMIVAPVFP